MAFYGCVSVATLLYHGTVAVSIIKKSRIRFIWGCLCKSRVMHKKEAIMYLPNPLCFNGDAGGCPPAMRKYATANITFAI